MAHSPTIRTAIFAGAVTLGLLASAASGGGPDGVSRRREIAGEARGQVEVQPTRLSPAGKGGARIVAITQHAGSDAWTLSLDSGVRVHFREMPEGLSLSVCLWGEVVSETDPAILRVVGEALEEPDLRGATPAERAVRVNAWATGDSIRIEIEGRGGDAEAMFAAASRLFRGDCIDDDRAEELIRRQREREQREERSAQAALQQAAWRALRASAERGEIAGGDVCGAWQRILVQGEIDVGIAGDIPRARVMDLARDAFAREWEGPGATRGAGAGEADEALEGIEIERVEGGFAGRAVLVGMIARAEPLDMRRVRALRLAADVLEDRLAQRIARGEVGARYEARAGMSNRRMLYGVAIDGGEGDGEAIREELERLAREGVGDEEIAKAGAARAERAQELLDRTGYWAGVLSERSRLAIDLDDVIGAPGAYRRIDAQGVRSALAELAETAKPVRIVIVGTKAPER